MRKALAAPSLCFQSLTVLPIALINVSRAKEQKSLREQSLGRVEMGLRPAQAGALSIRNEKGWEVKQCLVWARKNGKGIKQIQKEGRLMVAAIIKDSSEGGKLY